ncbi:TrmH family RNA methyltransferase [Oricola cellulosilytica]|uniref:RNA methyltransferase n=1 Tax=Oricola cellulosilytica TaxID=1429082 RepID=A0A4R0PER3_9HYPH|nr:RNA methyltransferase [Oricola cellulosilytica]TCD16307.1 RNA methyltransferase [Oricola cellulosilytica]
MSSSIAAPGRVKEVTSLANPIIKDIRLLEKKRHRDETGTFLAEGMKLVIDAIENGWDIRTLIYAKAGKGNEQIEALAARCLAKGADILIVSEKVLGAIARRDNPQMVMGVFEQRWTDPASISPDEKDVWVALDRVRDPGNLGTIIRTADAAGAKGIILVGQTTDAFATETVRATMGSVFAVPLARMDEAEFSTFAKNWPGMVAGTHLKGAIDYRKPDYDAGPVLLLMGNEQAGLPDILSEACSILIKIPQAGRADSLNLAIATGICLYEIRRSALTFDGASE